MQQACRVDITVISHLYVLSSYYIYYYRLDECPYDSDERASLRVAAIRVYLRQNLYAYFTQILRNSLSIGMGRV